MCVCIMVLLTACGAPKPEETVAKYLDLAKKADYTAMKELVLTDGSKAQLEALAAENEDTKELTDYIKECGKKIEYKIENLTSFRQGVIDIMNEIPFGETITYNDISRKIAEGRGIKRMSSQAVGGAVGWNQICIIIPCHRVVGSDGKLKGYIGGSDIKRKLLQIEEVDEWYYRKG